MSKETKVLLVALQTLQNIAERGMPPIKTGLPRQSFGFGDSAIFFEGENYSQYLACIDRAYNSLPEFAVTLTRKSFTETIIATLRRVLDGTQKSDESAAELVVKDLESISSCNHVVLRPIYGVSLSENTKRRDLGDYAVYRYSDYVPIVDSNQIEFPPELPGQVPEPEYVLSFEHECREHAKAIEVADHAFIVFENVLRYILLDVDHRHEVGIINYYGWQNTQAISFNSREEVSFSYGSKGAYQTVPIEDPYFDDASNGYDQIWKLCSRDKKTKIQSKILQAVFWIGKSLGEMRTEVAFISAAIALESLLSYNDKEVLNPSIMHRIAEAVAFIIGDGPDERIAAERQVKKLYGLRSKIAHGGSTRVTVEDYVDLLIVVKKIVTKLLTQPEYQAIKSIEELYELIKTLKYR